MVEIVGRVVEGPIGECETLAGGIKLVLFAGSVATMYRHQVHPSFVNLKPDQALSYEYETFDTAPQIRLIKEK